MKISETVDRFGNWLDHWPNEVLTLSLLAAAAVLVWVAFTEKPAGKAIVLAWILLP